MKIKIQTWLFSKSFMCKIRLFFVVARCLVVCKVPGSICTDNKEFSSSVTSGSLSSIFAVINTLEAGLTSHPRYNDGALLHELASTSWWHNSLAGRCASIHWNAVFLLSQFPLDFKNQRKQLKTSPCSFNFLNYVIRL